jgi:hypothetical protein
LTGRRAALSGAFRSERPQALSLEDQRRYGLAGEKVDFGLRNRVRGVGKIENREACAANIENVVQEYQVFDGALDQDFSENFETVDGGDKRQMSESALVQLLRYHGGDRTTSCDP